MPESRMNSLKSFAINCGRVADAYIPLRQTPPAFSGAASLAAGEGAVVEFSCALDSRLNRANPNPPGRKTSPTPSP